jgi:hypothetical protein
MYGSIEMAHYKNKKLNLGGTSRRNKKFKTRNKKRISESPYSPHTPYHKPHRTKIGFFSKFWF